MMQKSAHRKASIRGVLSGGTCRARRGLSNEPKIAPNGPPGRKLCPVEVYHTKRGSGGKSLKEAEPRETHSTKVVDLVEEVRGRKSPGSSGTSERCKTGSQIGRF